MRSSQVLNPTPHTLEKQPEPARDASGSLFSRSFSTPSRVASRGLLVEYVRLTRRSP